MDQNPPETTASITTPGLLGRRRQFFFNRPHQLRATLSPDEAQEDGLQDILSVVPVTGDPVGGGDHALGVFSESLFQGRLRGRWIGSDGCVLHCRLLFITVHH